MVDPTRLDPEAGDDFQAAAAGGGLIAAYAASLKPGDILSLVGAAFSLAGSTLFPALVLGVFWKRANQPGAIAGMVAGFAVCAVLHAAHQSRPGRFSAAGQWFHIAPISAGVFGVPAGLRRAGDGQPVHRRAGRAHAGIH